MKSLLLLLCSLILSVIALSQGSRKVQLPEVVEEAVNNYEKYRGELVAADDYDSTYASLVTIEGTKDNHIAASDKLIQYYCFIADSATRQSAKALLQLWRRKVKQVVGSYEEQSLVPGRERRKINSYRFINIEGDIIYSLTLMYSKRRIDAYYWVLLTIAKQSTRGVENGAY